MNASEADRYTMDARLCDDAGMISDEHVTLGAPGATFDPELTYRRLLNNLRAHTGLAPYTGPPIGCTGSAHLAGEHIRCTNPRHTTMFDGERHNIIVLDGEGAERAAEILIRRGKAQPVAGSESDAS